MKRTKCGAALGHCGNPAAHRQTALGGLGYITVLGQEIPEPQDLITSVSVDTTHGPPLFLADPLKPSREPSKVAPILRALKPKITIRFAPLLGQRINPVVIAPFGEPGPSDFEKLQGYAYMGAAFVGTLAVLGALSVLKGSGRKPSLAKRAARFAARKGARAAVKAAL